MEALKYLTSKKHSFETPGLSSFGTPQDLKRTLRLVPDYNSDELRGAAAAFNDLTSVVKLRFFAVFFAGFLEVLNHLLPQWSNDLKLVLVGFPTKND